MLWFSGEAVDSTGKNTEGNHTRSRTPSICCMISLPRPTPAIQVLKVKVCRLPAHSSTPQMAQIRPTMGHRTTAPGIEAKEGASVLTLCGAEQCVPK